MNYIEIVFNVFSFNNQKKEILIAHLYQFGFDSFEYKEQFLHAFIPDLEFNLSLFKNYLSSLGEFTISSINLIRNQNWNAMWESSFQPIFLDDMTVKELQNALQVPITIVDGADEIVSAAMGHLAKII